VADHGSGREAVGTVAEETARLVEALGDWAQGFGADESERARPGADGARPGAQGARPGADDAGERPAQTSRCEHCGVSSRAGEAITCQLCPLCQGISLLRTVRPETVQRLADLAGALSGVLRDIAADRFRDTPAEPPTRGQRVHDIDVDDEDEPAAPASAPTAASPTAASPAGAPAGDVQTPPSTQGSAAP
jgi:hypothetical protein